MPWHTCLFSPERIIQSALAEHCPTGYLIGARRQGLRVNCVKRKVLFSPVRLSYKNQNLPVVRNLALNTRIQYSIPVSAKANGFPPWFILSSSWTPWWVVEHRTTVKYISVMTYFSNRKFKRNLNELHFSDNETEAPSSFIIIESNCNPITNSSPFINEKVISTNLTPITVKKF